MTLKLKDRSRILSRAAVAAVAGVVGLAASAAQAGLGVSNFGSGSDAFTAWPSTTTTPTSASVTDPVISVATPNSAVNLQAETLNQNSIRAGTFTTTGSGFALSSISIITSGAGHATPDMSVHLYEMNTGYTPASGGYVPATATVGSDLFGSGNGLTFAYGGQGPNYGITEFVLSGLDRALLKPNTSYAFEIWNTSSTPLFLKRVGAGATVNDNPYAGGQIYGTNGDPNALVQGSTVSRNQVAGGPRNMLMSVQGFTPTRPISFLQVDVNGGGAGDLHPNQLGWSAWGNDPDQSDVIPNGVQTINKTFTVPSVAASSGAVDIALKSVNVSGGAYVEDGPLMTNRDSGAPNNNGAFGVGNVYRDLAIAEAGATASNGTNHRMEIALTGLDANTPYSVTFYAYDNFSPNSAFVFTDVTSNPLADIPSAVTAGDAGYNPGDGTGGTQYAPSGQTIRVVGAPTTNDQYALTLTATSDGTGKLIFNETTVVGFGAPSQGLPLLNGIEVTRDQRSWTGTSGSNWSATTSWANGWVASGLGSSANFGNGGALAVNVDAPVTVGRMNFSGAGAATISGSTITLNDSSINSTLSGSYTGRTEINLTSTAGPQTISAPLVLAKDTQVWTQTNAQTLTVSNLQPSAVILRKAGLGTLEVNNVRTNALQVNSGAVRILPNATATGVSKVNDLSVASGATLNLTDNKLIVSDPVGTWTGSAYTGVSGLVDAGRGNAANAQWDGSGIVTSDTRAVNNNDLVSIGTAKVGAFKAIADDATTTFAGQTVLGSDTIAMVTWGGDANLDGKINIDDYGQIDFNVGSSGSVFGWFNGDFNYDGKINIDDYGIIDFNVSAQSGTFPTAGGAGGGLEGVAAVPEPAALSLLALGAVGMLRRARRTTRG